MFKYFPHTPTDVEEMLKQIGVEKIDDLFLQIPSQLKMQDVNLPQALSESELRKEFDRLGRKNQEYISFLGAGSYDTLNFAVVNAITSRQEFLTSYTPYQPEISQGTLQYIFEYQSMMCELTGMDVCNASMYDGATATAEAMFMAVSQSRKHKVLISSSVAPQVIEVVKTYAKYRGIEIILIDADNYATSIDDLKQKYDENVGSIIVSQPNFYGVIEDYDAINQFAKTNNLVFVMNCDPSTLPVLKTPRAWGADIACGEAQSLGIPLACGGPYLGYLTCTNQLLRKMPGRICGMTKDVDGKRGFVLTLQAREQHIRREKANSNICSNQSLMALHVVIYMSLLGKTGLKEVAMRSYNNTHYLVKKLLETKKFSLVNNQPFFKEVVMKYDGDAKALNEYLLNKGFLSGLLLKDNCLLLCASEARTKTEIDDFVRLVGDYNG